MAFDHRRNGSWTDLTDFTCAGPIVITENELLSK